VKQYWKESLPLRSSRTAYLVVPEGFGDIACTIKGGEKIAWRGWSIEAVASPGHSADHLAFAARKEGGPLLLFCGDAMATPGTMATPYTTDWDHWTDLGLKPAAASLRKLARLKPALVLPAHGGTLKRDAAEALGKTAENVEDVAFLKSFERYTKKRLGKEPKYAFLAKEQAESNGSKPWAQISKHLWLTGNTYVLRSDDGPFLVFDPWDPNSAKQIPKLKADQKLGPLEVVMFSHAHYDHYDGIYSLLTREKPKVWALDLVAGPLAEPFLLRAPFLDARPVKFDRTFKAGESARWREYTFKFHFLPGQSYFTMGVETTIDGKHCLFTADNWFHQDQFSGSGGWMGLNRSSPITYGASAKKVLALRPEWVLAEHGGAFEFNAEDFRRRAEWGKVGEQSANTLCPSGSLRHDWDPHRVHVEPVLQRARAGAKVKATLFIANPLKKRGALSVTLGGTALRKEHHWEIALTDGGVKKEIEFELRENLGAGRHVLPLRVLEGDRVDGSDAFAVIDVGP
jgi:glyoxylase-like metal-dependent hydrolase (beta-lactamase superfamily II)